VSAKSNMMPMGQYSLRQWQPAVRVCLGQSIFGGPTEIGIGICIRPGPGNGT